MRDHIVQLAAGRARAGIEALIDIVPRRALRLRNGTREAQEVPAADLVVGDVVVILNVNEVAITGKSVPVAKTVGSQLYACSINANGELRIEITQAAAHTRPFLSGVIVSNEPSSHSPVWLNEMAPLRKHEVIACYRRGCR